MKKPLKLRKTAGEEPRRAPVYVVMRRRGNGCLAVTAVLSAFTAMTMLGSGGQLTPLHTWLCCAVATAGLASVACYVAASARSPKQSVTTVGGSSQRVDAGSPVSHPPVSHPTHVAVLTPLEQVK